MTNVNELRRKTQNGYSLYLDYRLNGKRIQERTGLTLLEGKDTVTRMHNKEVIIRYKYLIVEKQKQLMDGIASVPLSVQRQKINFFDYYDKYMVLNPSKERRATATLKKLKQFCGSGILPITDITEELLICFKNYLEANLTGETPYHYFKHLKMVLKQATKDKLFVINPASDIKVPCIANEPKNALSPEELKLLIVTECPNVVVKRAFLFSCFTGLRFCDILRLRWANITPDNIIDIIQKKTSHRVVLPLVRDAFTQLGTRKSDSELVFNLPTSNGTNKSIKIWVKNAGITKPITYHCARHSFATNVYEAGADIYATSAALGHKSLKETPRYVKLSERILNEAILKLDTIMTVAAQ